MAGHKSVCIFDGQDTISCELKKPDIIVRLLLQSILFALVHELDKAINILPIIGNQFQLFNISV